MTHQCPNCKNEFVQPFRCTTCGAQKLYDATVTSLQARNDALAERLAEAERIMRLAIASGDFVSDNVLYVYKEDYEAMERFLATADRENVTP
jgi:hypothetical protein